VSAPSIAERRAQLERLELTVTDRDRADHELREFVSTRRQGRTLLRRALLARVSPLVLS
jgi:hypothetical protein